MDNPRTGRVIFVGAGPGSADLITVRGSRALALADVVLFDALTDHALRDLAPDVRWINVGKRGFDHGTAQAHINALMVAHARRGLTVVRLKGGDPSIFGRLEEELEVMQQEGVPCEVIPGVTAALAAAAQSLRPLTRRGRGRSVSLTTAVTREGAGAGRADGTGRHTAARTADTEVFYMAGQQLSKLPGQLQAAGWSADTPASVVSQAGTPDMIFSQHTVASLDQAVPLHHGLPTVVTVGVGATAIGPTTKPRASVEGEASKLPSSASPSIAPASSTQEPPSTTPLRPRARPANLHA